MPKHKKSSSSSTKKRSGSRKTRGRGFSLGGNRRGGALLDHLKKAALIAGPLAAAAGAAYLGHKALKNRSSGSRVIDNSSTPFDIDDYMAKHKGGALLDHLKKAALIAGPLAAAAGAAYLGHKALKGRSKKNSAPFSWESEKTNGGVLDPRWGPLDPSIDF